MEATQIFADRTLDVKEIHILWTPDGTSCEGDTVSVTAASQPSIEDIVRGANPGLPKVHLHDRVLAYEQGGDDFMKPWHAATRGELAPIKPPPLAEWIINLGEAAEYLFDDCIFQDNLVGVDLAR